MNMKPLIAPLVLIHALLTPGFAQERMVKPAASVVRPAITSRTITVGGDTSDVRGMTSAAIQTAVDALRISGGGTVKIRPGLYTVTSPIRLFSNVSLIGSGPATILKKCGGARTRFTVDADYGELHLTVEDPSGFTPGMGVQVFDADQNDGWAVTTAVITKIEGKVLTIDDYLVRDYEADRGGTVSNACSIISAVDAENVTIADLTVDGNRKDNDPLNGCRGGGVYLHKVKRALVEKVTVKDFDRDGISWQITEDVTVRGCDVSGCANAGLHPGTGSPRTLIENNDSHGNDGFGLFVCWRVTDGAVRNNRFHDNNGYGVCTGHKDTDMLFEGNMIFGNGIDGVNFRGETGANAPHRTVFRNNTVENNGRRNGGCGFSFESPAEGVVLEGNTIRNAPGGPQKAAVRIGPNGMPVTLRNNRISGHPEGEVVHGKNPNDN
jgi:hypothetical protein